MGNFKDEIHEFYKKENSFRFSKNMWLDLLGHGLIGLTLGIVIILIRGTNPMPTLLLLPTVTTLWGLRNHLRKNKVRDSEH
jgi:hypothetical protein